MNVHSPEAGRAASLAQALQGGDRRALAQSITLVESRRPEDAEVAARLVEACRPTSGRAVRIGLSGAPGVGKSTFIEALGCWLVAQGHRIAVLAVDPSSRRSGGSILGDKTRMVQLAQSSQAFIRPSPAGMTLGGVARRTREAMVLVEAAGFDVVLVETVGVGQSETAVADMVDMFVVLVSPSGGDELQGIKRGIMELADIVVVTKSDGDLMPAASRTAAEYRGALHLLKPKFPGWAPSVCQVSSPAGMGLAGVWEQVGKFRETLQASGRWDSHRREQLAAWFRTELSEGLQARLTASPAIRAELARIEQLVMGGDIAPPAAARLILTRAFGES